MYTLTFTVLKLASGYVATAIVGGLNIRGGRRATAIEAAQSLFLVLSGNSGNMDDSAIAVDLMLADTTITDAIAGSLTDGKGK